MYTKLATALLASVPLLSAALPNPPFNKISVTRKQYFTKDGVVDVEALTAHVAAVHAYGI
jgi:hypothetical protein